MIALIVYLLTVVLAFFILWRAHFKRAAQLFDEERGEGAFCLFLSLIWPMTLVIAIIASIFVIVSGWLRWLYRLLFETLPNYYK